MDYDQAKIDVINWIARFTEAPLTGGADWLCCYHACDAYTKGQLDVRLGATDPYTDLRFIELGRFESIAVIYDICEFSYKEFCQQVQDVNTAFLKPKQLIASAYHPAAHDSMGKVAISPNQWAIAFVRRSAK